MPGGINLCLSNFSIFSSYSSFSSLSFFSSFSSFSFFSIFSSFSSFTSFSSCSSFSSFFFTSKSLDFQTFKRLLALIVWNASNFFISKVRSKTNAANTTAVDNNYDSSISSTLLELLGIQASRCLTPYLNCSCHYHNHYHTFHKHCNIKCSIELIILKNCTEFHNLT